MDKSGQGGIVYFLIMIIAMVGLVFLIYTIASDVGYSININNNEIQLGNTLILSVVVDNARVFDDIEEVELRYYIKDEFGVKKEEGSIPIDHMDARSLYSNDIIIETSGLKVGKYRIWTELEYKLHRKIEIKKLSLDFIIVN